MAISKDDRISISRRILELRAQSVTIQASKVALQSRKTQLESLDAANKSLQNNEQTIINGYQTELSYIDGLTRTTLSESDIQSGAKRELGNGFYPNDTDNPPASLPSGIWNHLVPYALGLARGRAKDESLPSGTSEQDLHDAIDTFVTQIEALTDVQRSTGQKCTNGTCSLPQYDNQTDCTGNGGVWTPGPDNIQEDTDLTDLMTNIKATVNSLRTRIQNQVDGTVSDTDATRASEASTALSNAQTAVSAIDTWLALQDFDTTHGETTCAGWNSINVSTLADTKWRATELNALKSALSTRSLFLPTRSSQLSGYLGDISQNVSTGAITSSSGMYGRRWAAISTRLRLLDGSLVSLTGVDNAIASQDSLIEGAEEAEDTYSNFLDTFPLSSPSNNTRFVHIKGDHDLSAGQNIYVMADNVSEIQTKVVSVNGGRIELTSKIPEGYKNDNFGRVYRLI